MDNTFDDEERLYRAIRPFSMFWKSNNQISSAAFSSNKNDACSVDRGYNRSDIEVISDMTKRLEGKIVYIKVMHCREVDIDVEYDPMPDNEYHSIIKSKESNTLSHSQRKHIAGVAKVIN